MRSKTVVEFFRVWFEAFGLTVQYFITSMGSRLLPLASASLFSFGIYEFALEMSGNPIASVAMGFMAAIGVESVGFNSAHYAVDSYENGRPMKMAMFFVGAYLAVGGGTLWLVDVATIHKVMTSALFGMVGINYALLGITEQGKRTSRRATRSAADEAALNQEERLRERALQDADRIRAQQLQDEDRAWKRQLQGEKISADRNLQLQRIEASKVVQIADSKAQAVSAVAMRNRTMQSAGQSSDKPLSNKRKGQLRILQEALQGDFAVAEVQKLLQVKPRAAYDILKAGKRIGVIADSSKKGVYHINGVTI